MLVVVVPVVVPAVVGPPAAVVVWPAFAVTLAAAIIAINHGTQGRQEGHCYVAHCGTTMFDW